MAAALLGAVVFLGIQTRLDPILTLGFSAVPALLPDIRIRVLLGILVFVTGLIACYRPSNPAQSCSQWWCCLRALLWGLLLGGFWFEFGCILRFSLLPVSVASMFEMAKVVFAIVWVVAFAILSGDANLRRRELKAESA